MVVQSADEAVSNAKSWKTCSPGMCLYTTQEWFESPHAYPDATTQWKNAKYRHTDDNPPKGAPVFWTGGGNNYGHACISLGDSRIRSTDCQNSKQVSDTDLSWPRTHWGLTYAGWTEDIGNVTIPYLRGGTAGGGGTDGGLLGMTDVDKFSRSKAQSFTGNGKFQTLKITDDDALSLLTGPKDLYVAVAGITISDMAAGDVCQIRYQAVSDYPDSRSTVVEYSYPIAEIIGTSGNTYGQITWSNDLGKSPKSDAKLRLRLFVNPPNGKKITVSHVTARCLY